MYDMVSEESRNVKIIMKDLYTMKFICLMLLASFSLMACSSISTTGKGASTTSDILSSTSDATSSTSGGSDKKSKWRYDQGRKK